MAPPPKKPVEKIPVPAEMPPQAAPDHLAKRDRLIVELEKAAKESTGSLQGVLRKLGTMLNGTKPGMPYNPQAMNDVKAAFTRYASDTTVTTHPPVLMEAVEWMQTYLAQRGFPANQPGAATAGAATAGAAPSGTARSTGSRPALTPSAKGAKDGFDSRSTASHAQTIGGEAPLNPGQSTEQRQQLDSMKETLKNWQLNSQLGKVKG
jgi:hypothetical protein